MLVTIWGLVVMVIAAAVLTDSPKYDVGRLCFTEDQNVIIMKAEYNSFQEPTYVVRDIKHKIFTIKETDIKSCSNINVLKEVTKGVVL